MARRPTRDRNGNILPMRVRQPVAYWMVLIVSVLMVVSLVAGGLAALLG